MQFGLILSLDYEIFGNGTGSVKKHIVSPTDRILKICNDNNFKLTIMFEVCEYWAFKQAENEGILNHLEYSPSKDMELQIQEAVRQGHDVQLHMHPQWLNSKYLENRWSLDFNQWKLSDLPTSNTNSSNKYTILKALEKGKNTLEDLLKPIDNNYSCIAFRAGSWCIQPEKDILKAMKTLGIKIDSSVFKGGLSYGISDYNYESAPYSIGYWWTQKDNVCSIGPLEENIIEAPIQTVNMPFYKNYNFQKLKSVFSSRIKKKSSEEGYASSYPSIFTNPFSNYPFKFDFCKLNFKEMVSFVRIAQESKYYQEEGVVPIVAIGHSKDFFNERAFSQFLQYG